VKRLEDKLHSFYQILLEFDFDEVYLEFGSSTLQINFGTVLALNVNELLID
jgi:hypothetical protein